MAWWITLLWYVGAFIVSELLRPSPNTENAKPATLGDFNFPTATEGRVVPLVWGTNKIAGPNVVWYGDLATESIRETVKTSLFSSKKVTRGYKYFVGIQFALCRGPMNGTHDGIKRIWVDKEILWNYTVNVSPGSGLPVTDGDIFINEPEFFGKDSGGLEGTLAIFPGTETQAASTYLTSVLESTKVPAYRGTVYALYEQGSVGNAPTIRPWSFELTRIPNGLGLAGQVGSPPKPKDIINGQDANHMNVMYEILTNDEWGLGISAGEIDLPSFNTAAEVLAIEENGFSMVLDSPTEVQQVINQIEQQVDGLLLYDPVLAKFKFSLIRESDYPSPITDLVLISPDNAFEAQFSRGSWTETSNQVRIEFTDPDKDYVTSYAVAQDMANRRIQGRVVSSTLKYPGVKNRALANRLVWREIRLLAYPLAKVIVRANRDAYDLEPGSLFRFLWPPAGVTTEVFMRVNKIDPGDAVSGVVVIDGVQDIFETPLDGSFSDPSLTNWDAPFEAVQPIPSEDSLLVEAGYLINQLSGLEDPASASIYPRALSLVRDPSRLANQYDLQIDTRDFPAAFGGNFVSYGIQTGFTPCGVLRDAIPGLESTLPTQGAGSFKVDGTGSPPEDLSRIIDSAAFARDAIQNGASLIYIGDDENGEFAAFTQRTAEGSPVGGSGILVDGVYRGVVDTPPQSHAAGTRVWFINDDVGISNTSVGIDGVSDADIKARVLPRTTSASVSLTDSPEPPDSNTLRINNAYKAPQPITELNINGSRLPASANLNFDHGGGVIGLRFTYTRRDPRQTAVLSDIEGTSVLGGTFTSSGSGLNWGVKWWLYNLDTSPLPSSRGDAILNGTTSLDSSGNDTIDVLVADISTQTGSPLPTRMRIELETTHTFSETAETIVSLYPYIFDFDTTTS